MELNLELTPRSKILLGILGCVLLILLILQGAPIFYRLFANQGTKAKQEQLLKTENLVRVAEILKPIESEIYKAAGLAPIVNPQVNTRTQGTATLFDTESPETVIRARIDALVRHAGIQQNYQLLTKPVTAKQTQKLTMQTRENLVRYLYLKHIEAEEQELTEINEAQTEADAFNILMNAWLSGTETNEKTEKSDSSSSKASPFADVSPRATGAEAEDKARATNPIETAAAWKFVPLPEAIPISLRVKLATFIKTMTLQQLRGATDLRQGFFEAQIQKVVTPAAPGILRINAKPATVEIRLRRNGALLNFLTQVLDEVYLEEPLDIDELQSSLIKYIERVQEQQAILLDQLALAPPTYQTELYTVEMKFKTDLEKLVNLNHLIETGAKWLTVRDLRISADTQATARPEAGRGQNPENTGANLNVDILLIARIF
ncbi:MAG: hypothetical protein OXU36_23970 [Candidatus Poribacteria bacterium]|nr:hypothetical protein [Candidatus Poribacteria bacterium]